ncbi:MAG: 50S ribosomal protein L32 [Flavipsychrobacter sp.]|jgi:large subunit ribosomal protein L32|nr:50S ribosomal protein L32 [Chitinophagaceae bacterium]MBL7690489.1 50S ribosomal protein L32 [Flavipsychrobacter sp.]
MPNPKRRHSQQRGAKRRTHYKATAETWSIDKTTGESHLRHRAHWVEGKLYYRGNVVIDKTPATPEVESEPNQ